MTIDWLSDIGQIALSLAEAGIAILPIYTMRDGQCSCGKRDCHNAAKHPIGKPIDGVEMAPHGAHSASSDPETVRRWWTAAPDANIGLATGQPNGIYVQDIDNERIATVLLLAAQEGRMPTGTVMNQTGRTAGCHIFYRSEIDQRTQNLHTRDGEVIGELRGTGAYVLLPPSLHKSGNQYLSKLGDLLTAPPPTVDDPRAAIIDLLHTYGIRVAPPKLSSSSVFTGEVTALTPIDCPFDSSRNTLLRQMLRGETPTSDKSQTLLDLGALLWQEAERAAYDITEGQVAAVIKKVDEFPHMRKYAGRADADKRYWEKAHETRGYVKKMSDETEEPEDEFGDSDDDEPKKGKKSRKSLKPYYRYYDEEGLVRMQGKRETWLANYRPQVVAVHEIIGPEGKVVDRVHHLKLELEHEEIEVTLTTDDLHTSNTIGKAMGPQISRSYRTEERAWYMVWQAANEFEAHVETVREYATTGWVQTEKGWAFILPGADGAVTSDGLDASVKFYGFRHGEPERYLLYGSGVRPIESRDEREAASAALAELFAVLRPDVIVPMLCLVAGAPLKSLGLGTSPPLIHIYGETGQMKTTISLILLSLFGRFDGSASIPDAWSSTVTTLQLALHSLRDLPLLIDDYKTEAMRAADAARLVQNYADGTVRGRSGGDQQRRETVLPYALLLSTGEERFEQEQSTQARMFSLQFEELEKSSVAFEERKRRVTSLQAHVRAGALALVGGSYLRFLAQHGVERLSNEIASMRAEERKRTDLPVHARVVDSIVSLRIVERIFGGFLRQEFPELLGTWQMLRNQNATHRDAQTIAEAEEAQELSPARQVLAAVRGALMGENAKITHRYTNVATENALAYSTIGLWDSDGVYLSEPMTWHWYRTLQHRQGEKPLFSWRAVIHDACRNLGGEQRFLRERGNMRMLWIPHEHAGVLRIREDSDDGEDLRPLE